MRSLPKPKDNSQLEIQPIVLTPHKLEFVNLDKRCQQAIKKIAESLGIPAEIVGVPGNTRPILIAAFFLLASPAAAQHLVMNPYTGKVHVSCTPSRQVVLNTPAAKNDTPQTAELKKLYSQIVNNDVLLRQALKHEIPEYRFTAVYAIAIKKLPKHEELIELLADRHPSVSLAARQALVILTQKYGKREDFGPIARSNAEQVAEAQSEWRKWFDARREHLTRASK
jgi:hypothetical protein